MGPRPRTDDFEYAPARRGPLWEVARVPRRADDTARAEEGGPVWDGGRYSVEHGRTGGGVLGRWGYCARGVCVEPRDDQGSQGRVGSREQCGVYLGECD